MIKKRRLSLSRLGIMTLPDERYRSIMQARRLLEELCDPKLTPRVPMGIRDRARGALRHYPEEYYLGMLADSRPDILESRGEKLEPLYSWMKYSLDQVEIKNQNPAADGNKD